MFVVKEIGFYRDGEAVQWAGWINTIKGEYFITLEGDIVPSPEDPHPEIPGKA